jgi:small subunit ribosomal protein S13
MARIAGIELQDKWKIDFALTKIKGIGWSTAEKVLDAAGVDSSKRVKELSQDEVSKIASEIEGKPIEGELVRRVRKNIQRLQQIGSYRGKRHKKNLPVRGQRTKTNARTKRGKRKTVGAFKKEALVKQQGRREEEEEK